jgi:hypothetical protein
MIKCCYKNILEASSVSLSAGAEDPGYPLYRLYDRNIGRMFKAASAVTTEIKIDRGGTATPSPVDRLIIPSGHNLGGMTLDIKYSDDDAVYTPAVSQWVQADSGLIVKSWAAATRRYWKFVVTAPSAAPQIPELFLTSTYEWERPPSRPCGFLDKVFNVERTTTAGGQDRFLVHGDPKRQREYSVPRCGETQKQNILALNDCWAGCAPFFLCDHEGVWIFGGLKGPIDLKEVAYRTYGFEFDFMEVLP